MMRHSDDYISPFVPLFDIPVSLGDLFQRIVIDRPIIGQCIAA